MKFIVQFKTPDAVDNALKDFSGEQWEDAMEVASKFVEYCECISVEFDTEKGTAIVLNRS